LQPIGSACRRATATSGQSPPKRWRATSKRSRGGADGTENVFHRTGGSNGWKGGVGIADVLRQIRDGDRLFVLHRGVTSAVRNLTLAAPATAASNGGDGKVRAAMNGRVVAVLVKPGEKLELGQPVMTLEAMKMEHVHTAGIAGTIAAIDVTEGEQVTTGRIVIEIEAAT
jgi:geranyl-CoA carboxylase alpha subunit